MAIPLVLFWNSIEGPLVIMELDRNGLIKEQVAFEKYPQWEHNLRREMGLYVTRFHAKALLWVTVSGAVFSLLMWLLIRHLAVTAPMKSHEELSNPPR